MPGIHRHPLTCRNGRDEVCLPNISVLPGRPAWPERGWSARDSMQLWRVRFKNEGTSLLYELYLLGFREVAITLLKCLPSKENFWRRVKTHFWRDRQCQGSFCTVNKQSDTLDKVPEGDLIAPALWAGETRQICSLSGSMKSMIDSTRHLQDNFQSDMYRDSHYLNRCKPNTIF